MPNSLVIMAIMQRNSGGDQGTVNRKQVKQKQEKLESPLVPSPIGVEDMLFQRGEIRSRS